MVHYFHAEAPHADAAFKANDVLMAPPAPALKVKSDEEEEPNGGRRPERRARAGGDGTWVRPGTQVNGSGKGDAATPTQGF
ncbi:hypothetical protein E2562_028424 [Oryza meyeriana var. granulata]|uniref:Uncharacterized protein n=1 Tax=Oryza meyeriana var. granulata TaxID=110450 RepID=A0A6G1EQL0_9ORYZ|nr:hypothetical protein E2562_028424 [Oryza meyeriana var. granulata]